MLPLITVMTQNLARSESSSSRRRRRSPTPPSSPVRMSSPPPEIADELDIFLAEFGKTVVISNEALTAAGNSLRSAYFMPNGLSEDSISIDHLKELTGLPEGVVHSLRIFAREWSGKVANKRAKRARLARK